MVTGAIKSISFLDVVENRRTVAGRKKKKKVQGRLFTSRRAKRVNNVNGSSRSLLAAGNGAIN